MKNNGSSSSGENVFLRIDDYLSQDVCQALVRSYSADYLNESATPRTRIKYIRIPGDIMKTEIITHYQYNVVPPEYRTVPYGLRYWSILKLLQEERDSGQPYVYLGDAYLGQPPQEWMNSQSVIKDILKNGGHIDPNTFIGNNGELYKKNLRQLDNNEIELFMSTSNLEKEIEMVKNKEQIIRNLNIINAKPKQSNFMAPMVITEKTIKYEKLPDRIISTVEKIEYDAKKMENSQNRLPIYGKNVNYKEVNGHQGIKKYPLIEDVIKVAEKSVSSSRIIDNNSVINKISQATTDSAGMYGHYYPDTSPQNSSQSDFLSLESIISKKIDDTKNYLRALSAESLLNDPSSGNNSNAQYSEFQPNLRNQSISKSLKDMTTYERTLTMPDAKTLNYNAPSMPEYVCYEADESQIQDILNGKLFNFEEKLQKPKRNENSFVYNQLIGLNSLYNNSNFKY